MPGVARTSPSIDSRPTCTPTAHRLPGVLNVAARLIDERHFVFMGRLSHVDLPENRFAGPFPLVDRVPEVGVEVVIGGLLDRLITERLGRDGRSGVRVDDVRVLPQWPARPALP